MVRHVALVRSPEDPNCYCVGSHGQSLLERSLTGLSLVMEDDTASPRAEVCTLLCCCTPCRLQRSCLGHCWWVCGRVLPPMATTTHARQVASRVSRGWGILEAFSHVTAFAAKAVSGGGAAKPKPLPFGEDPIETVAAGPAVVPVEVRSCALLGGCGCGWLRARLGVRPCSPSRSAFLGGFGF